MRDFIIRYWVQALFAAVLAAGAAAYRKLSSKLKKQLGDQKSLRDGTQALLRNGIIQQYEKYIARGYVPLYALENILALYKAYHALGGNGAITKLIGELRALPTQEPNMMD